MIEERERASVQKKELNKTAKVLYNSEKQVEEKKKVAAGFSKDRLLLEHKHKKRKADIEKKACTHYPRLSLSMLGQVNCLTDCGWDNRLAKVCSVVLSTSSIGSSALHDGLLVWTEQSPDSAKVKEGLHRLQKRLRAEKKVVDEKEKKYKEQQQHIAKLQADLQRITDGTFSHVRFMTHV